MRNIGGGFFKLLLNKHTRDYPYRGERRQENFRETKSHLWRFFREYLWPFRWLLLLTVLTMGLNFNYQYVIAALNRVVVDHILVVTDSEGAPMISQDPIVSLSIMAHDRKPEARTPPTEGQGRRMARGVRITRRPAEAGKALFLLAILYVCTQCFFNFLARRVARMKVSLTTQVLGKLREDMHRKALELSLSYQQRISPGRLLSRIVSDTSAVRAEFTAMLELVIRLTSMVVVGFIVLLVSEWRVLAILMVTTPLFLYIRRHFIPIMRSLQREQRHTNSSLYGLISQKMDAIKAVQSYGQQEEEVVAFHRLSSAYVRDAFQVQFLFTAMNFLAWLTLHAANCTVFLVGGYLVATGRMSLGKLVFLQTLTQIFFQPVADYAELTFTNQRLQVALGRCYSVLDEIPEITEDPDAVDFPKPLHQGLVIRDLAYRYNAGHSDESPEVLSQVNLTVPAGEWLCIMGASGAGKSTLLHLLARLYTPTRGTIEYDGLPIDKIRFASLHQNLGVVPQEAQIFSGSVRDNIAYGYPDATNKQITDAAKAAQLHDFILDMPVQYETLIGEKGQSLSGGQRQRLSLARALLCNPEVLLLDDCTSALDANTERHIQETLMTQLAGKTAVIVSQRVSMAVRCQHIAILEKGRVTEYGTPQELLKLGGFYATLFHEQTQ
ncbi:MAG: ABC transporter ATP-binding protein/permease [Lentisphaeria bacterium]|nr:ABC transporter ATP-binding protein/permease [Lentisphaeria bacterium]